MDKSRSKEQIFTDMHRELRSFNPDIPESPDRLDPVLKILLQLYSNQLSRIDRRVDQVWDVAASSLIRSLCPESMRWPVPAFTLLRCDPSDPQVEIDPYTKFYYKESREGGQTFYFSALRREKLLAARTAHIFLKTDDSLLDLSPAADGSQTLSRSHPAMTTGGSYQVYVAVDLQGAGTQFADCSLFLTGHADVLRQLRWGYWNPGSHFGGFYEDSSFCPGLTTSLEQMFAGEDEGQDWGGLRSGADLFRPLQDNFVVIPENFAATWEMGPPDPKLAEMISSQGYELAADAGNLFWLRIDLPKGGDKTRLQAPFEINFNCFVAVNKNELTLFKHTGGNRLVEVELPESISAILDVVKVVDSSGREYFPQHMLSPESDKRHYTLEERADKLILWFDFTDELELPPDSLSIVYAVTGGTDANGIEAGKITELYENHPGLSAVSNILPATGAIPAKTEKQIMAEVSARLRNRDRSVGFNEIARWAGTFDPRILTAECRNGVERFEAGVRRCIVVSVTIKDDQFYSDDEVELLKTRLHGFLKARSSVNAQYLVEIVKR